MKSKILVPTISLILAILFTWTFAAAQASAEEVTLSLEDVTVNNEVSTTVDMRVIVDKTGQIAGAAFTVLYNTSDLTLTRVTSDFFGTFQNQFSTLNPNAETSVTGYDVDGDVEYTQPLINSEEKQFEDPPGVGGVMIAAARVLPGETNTVLFTLTFDVTQALPGTVYPIRIVPSIIRNEAAGYDPDGEEIPMFVGATIDPDIPLSEAFPVIPVFDPSNIEGTIEITATTTTVIDVSGGWNLLSLYTDPSNTSIDSVLGDIEDNIDSAWKWTGDTWAVYLPNQPDQGAGYASSKGFVSLTEISSGEGFWVNSNAVQTLTVSGTQPADTSRLLESGWNLIGLKSNQMTSITDLISGNENQVASVWKWDSGTWAVYLPGDTDGGAAYATDNGFNELSFINPGEGFWMNCEQDMVIGAQ